MKSLPSVLVPALTLAATLGASAAATAQERQISQTVEPGPDYRYVLFGFDLLPGIGTSSLQEPVVRRLSLNLIGGRAAGLAGIEVGSLFNLEDDFVKGAQFSGGANIVGGHVVGLQLSGGANVLGGDAYGLLGTGGANVIDGVGFGVAVSGGANVIEDGYYGFLATGGANAMDGDGGGVQLAGGANVVNIDFGGLQLTGGANVVGNRAAGVQIAGGANVAGARMSGLQIAGGANVSDFVRGVQIAGGANIAGDSVVGGQIGVANIAGTARGAQIGVVNISEKSDFALGLVNIVTDGRTHLDVWGADSGYFNFALKHGGDHFHYFYGLGAHALQQEDPAVLFGLGGHLPINPDFFIDLDQIGSFVADGTRFDSLKILNTTRLTAGIPFSEDLAVVAGPTFNLWVSDVSDGQHLVPFGSDVSTQREELHVRAGMGLFAGLQFL